MLHGWSIYLLGPQDMLILTLLTPSVKALKILAAICEQYANKFDVLFNGKKNLLIIYKCTRSQSPHPSIVINNVSVPRVDEVILLWYYMYEDIYKFNASKCVSDFNRQSAHVFLPILSMLTLI